MQKVIVIVLVTAVVVIVKVEKHMKNDIGDHRVVVGQAEIIPHQKLVDTIVVEQKFQMEK